MISETEPSGSELGQIKQFENQAMHPIGLAWYTLEWLFGPYFAVMIHNVLFLL